MNISSIKQQVNWIELLLGILCLIPIFVGYRLYHDPLLLNVGLVTISLYVPIARTHSGIYLAIVQFILIWFCFTLLFFALSEPYIFVLLSALIAFGSIYITRYGVNLRTMGNFVFIPAIYLACELRESLPTDALFAVYVRFITLLPIAFFSIMILLIAKAIYIYCRNPKQLPLGNHLHQVVKNALHTKNNGEVKLNWLKEAIAIFLGVSISSFLVVFLGFAHGEWAIWSTAAVITVDLVSAKRKAQDRFYGLVFGIPLGFFVAQFIPKNTLFYALSVLGVMLTLIAFKNYRVAFGARCFFITLASFIATSTTQIALERIENVIIGGIIGMAALYICHKLFGRFESN